MKSYHLKLNLEWDISVPDEVEDSDILDELAERIAMNNETVANIFWEGIEITEYEDIPHPKFCDIDGDPINEDMKAVSRENLLDKAADLLDKELFPKAI